jgi:phage-related protein
VPKTKVIFYQDQDQNVPVLEWLKQLQKKDLKGFTNCIARIKQLQEFGHELRRPASDYLKDGILELRARHKNIQHFDYAQCKYRVLYFFDGQNIAILAHSIIKKGSAVPSQDIAIAIARKQAFILDSKIHTYQGDI